DRRLLIRRDLQESALVDRTAELLAELYRRDGTNFDEDAVDLDHVFVHKGLIQADAGDFPCGERSRTIVAENFHQVPLQDEGDVRALFDLLHPERLRTEVAT